MKKNILKILLFIFIIILIIICLSNVLIPKNNTRESGIHYYEASGLLAEPENTIDMIVVGDSEPYTSISPMELWNQYGYTSYTCSSLEAKLYETVQILSKVKDKQKPKVLLMEVGYLYRKTKLPDAIEATLQTLIPAWEYHDRWKKLTAEDFTSKAEYNEINDLKGYHYTNQEEGCAEEDIMEYHDYYEPSPIPRANKLYFKLIKWYCEKNGIKLIGVRVPTMRDWNYATYLGIKKFLERENIEYWDMNMSKDEVKIDWSTDTKDGGGHLNHKGAIKVTKSIGKWLNKKNILPDHRQEKEYSNWHKSYERYLEIVSQGT